MKATAIELRDLTIALGRMKLPTALDRRRFVAWTIGRPIETAMELTSDDVRKCVERIDRETDRPEAMSKAVEIVKKVFPGAKEVTK